MCIVIVILTIFSSKAEMLSILGEEVERGCIIILELYNFLSTRQLNARRRVQMLADLPMTFRITTYIYLDPIETI